MLTAAAAHKGTALVEIYQNCNIFNDGAFDALKDPETRDPRLIRLETASRSPGRAEGGAYRGRRPGARARGRPAPGARARRARPGLEHAFALSRLADLETLDGTPIGILRQVTRPTYDELMNTQLDQATARQGDGDLGALLAGSDTWSIGQ